MTVLAEHEQFVAAPHVRPITGGADELKPGAERSLQKLFQLPEGPGDLVRTGKRDRLVTRLGVMG